MQSLRELMKIRAQELLRSGAVDAVLGWKEGELPYDAAPALFRTPEELESLVYDGFCGSNLSKYLLKENKKPGKTLVFLKPCDSYSFNQLLSEGHVDRAKVYAVGVGCEGKIDIRQLRDQGMAGIQAVEEEGENLVVHTLYGTSRCKREDALLVKCQNCKGEALVDYDEYVGEAFAREPEQEARFAPVLSLEGLRPDERFAFWRGKLSHCIRCNACREACPACSCVSCVFDNKRSGVSAKANANDFEENLYHIIRAFHVAGRCTDCGECTRVCPQDIPLHLLNRKLIKDINAFYGEYQAGADTGADLRPPLLSFDREDVEPDVISRREGAEPC